MIEVKSKFNIDTSNIFFAYQVAKKFNSAALMFYGKRAADFKKSGYIIERMLSYIQNEGIMYQLKEYNKAADLVMNSTDGLLVLKSSYETVYQSINKEASNYNIYNADFSLNTDAALVNQQVMDSRRQLKKKIIKKKEEIVSILTPIVEIEVTPWQNYNSDKYEINLASFEKDVIENLNNIVKYLKIQMLNMNSMRTSNFQIPSGNDDLSSSDYQVSTFFYMACNNIKVNIEKCLDEATRQLNLLKYHFAKIKQFENRNDFEYAKERRRTSSDSTSSNHGTYVVEKGDYLIKIAAKYGIDWKELYEANADKIDNPNLIYPGQVLTIPGQKEENNDSESLAGVISKYTGLKFEEKEEEVFDINPPVFEGVIGAAAIGSVSVATKKTDETESGKDDKKSEVKEKAEVKEAASKESDTKEVSEREQAIKDRNEAAHNRANEKGVSAAQTSTNVSSPKVEVLDSDLASCLDERFEPGFSAKLEQVAKNVNCDPNDLLALMYSECALNPSHIEKSSRAVGLIQFMPSTARNLGYTTEQIANMSATDQLDLVEKYIKSSSPYKNGEELDAGTLYAVMFLPGRAKKNTLCSKGESYYTYNSGLDMDRDGVITKQDLANRLNKKYTEMLRDIM